jgi:hypothetical protein
MTAIYSRAAALREQIKQARRSISDVADLPTEGRLEEYDRRHRQLAYLKGLLERYEGKPEEVW